MAGNKAGQTTALKVKTAHSQAATCVRKQNAQGDPRNPQAGNADEDLPDSDQDV